jgi:ribosome-binding factor A
MAYRRVDRVRQSVHRELTALIQREIKDPAVGPLSVTDLWMSRDLRLVRATVSPLGGEGDEALILEALRAKAGWFQGEIARRLKLRVAPRLEFQIDEQLDEAIRMTSMLEEMARQRREREAEGGDALEGEE